MTFPYRVLHLQSPKGGQEKRRPQLAGLLRIWGVRQEFGAAPHWEVGREEVQREALTSHVQLFDLRPGEKKSSHLARDADNASTLLLPRERWALSPRTRGTRFSPLAVASALFKCTPAHSVCMWICRKLQMARSSAFQWTTPDPAKAKKYTHTHSTQGTPKAAGSLLHGAEAGKAVLSRLHEPGGLFQERQELRQRPARSSGTRWVARAPVTHGCLWDRVLILHLPHSNSHIRPGTSLLQPGHPQIQHPSSKTHYSQPTPRKCHVITVLARRGNFLTPLQYEKWLRKKRMMESFTRSQHNYKNHSVPLFRKRSVLVISSSARLSQISARNSVNFASSCQDSKEMSIVSVCTDTREWAVCPSSHRADRQRELAHLPLVP